MKHSRYLIWTLLLLALSFVGAWFLLKQKSVPPEEIAAIPTSTPVPITPILSPTIKKTTLTKTSPPALLSSPVASPTRIVLPLAGINFPSQALTIVGVIVTLLGFLVLL